MLPWTGVERRWRQTLMATMIPRVSPDGTPGFDEIDPGDFWDRFDGDAPPLFRLGLRVAVWALTWSPLFLVGRPRTFGRLDAAARDEVLVRAAGHALYPVRQLVDVLKLTACFAYLRDPTRLESR